MKFIAIIGSVQENRDYDPPVPNAAEARRTAELIGMELARRGYGIVVYAGGFIEGDVLRGFVKNVKAKRSIKVMFPSHQQGPEGFPEYVNHRARFELIVNESPDWEMSFYSSLPKVDGMVMIGGGHSTLIAGILALSYHIPIVAVQSTGGSGQTIWKALAAGRGLATQEEASQMAQKGDADTVSRWIDSLDSQYVARHKALRQGSGVGWATGAGVLVLAWVLTLPVGYCLLAPGEETAAWRRHAFIFLLFISPMLAGASGATMRMLLPETGIPTAKSTVFGMAAGAISGVLYVLSHLLANPEPHNFAILVISVSFGFVAGLTFDAVFKKLESVDALHTEVLKPGKR